MANAGCCLRIERGRGRIANADVEAVDFEPEEDDLMDEDGPFDVDAASPRAQLPKIKSAITSASTPKKTKGRGFRDEADTDRNTYMAGRFEALDSDGMPLRYNIWAVVEIGTTAFREEINVAKRDGMPSLCQRSHR